MNREHFVNNGCRDSKSITLHKFKKKGMGKEKIMQNTSEYSVLKQKMWREAPKESCDKSQRGRRWYLLLGEGFTG